MMMMTSLNGTESDIIRHRKRHYTLSDTSSSRDLQMKDRGSNSFYSPSCLFFSMCFSNAYQESFVRRFLAQAGNMRRHIWVQSFTVACPGTTSRCYCCFV